MTDNSHLHYAVEMVRNNIEAYLHELQQALPYVPPIPVEALYSLHIAQDYEGMVQLIKNTMNIDVCLRVSWVNSGGRDLRGSNCLPTCHFTAAAHLEK